MKLFKYGLLGEEKCGVVINGELCSVADYINDYDEKFFQNNGLAQLQTLVQQKADTLPRLEPKADFRYGAPIGRPSKIICIGLNYAKHAAESGMAVPKEPVIFFKATTALCGPNDNVIIPRHSHKTDWEVELAVVIGKKASYVEESDAMDYVAGYAVHNDYSEREFQLERAGQWVKGKSNDTFAPLGPFLVTKDEVPDPHNLHLWLSVNGERLQDSNTSDMVFKIPFLIAYISQFMTLLPGDVISTGTPFGVGFGFNPPRYLKPGDVVELGIEGLGTQRQMAVSWSAS
ncbi:MAG: fumarylacetoacetate hydrolase family protein [Cytophagales bacterium]|nr:fumarylacetoacetate hydrolase family protein [Bernardetiaceae bacterium]MDW8204466.1 fumarylacetoacetate hydrolase family protein [Cytophagales bacterium]